MALIRNHPSASLGEIRPWKIKVQIVRTSKGNKKESDNSIDLVLLDSSETRIHTTIDEALSRWIMNISGDNINNPNDGETEIDISKDLLITESKDPIKTLLKEVYGEYFAKSYNPDFCHDSAILCHRDDDVDQINDYMLSLLPGEEKECLSTDSISPSPNDDMFVPLEVLNSIKVPGLPDFKLRLKVGAPVMLLRDLDPSRGFFTGTRLQITRLCGFVLEAMIIAGNKHGKKIWIPRIASYPTETNFPLQMRRTQYPLKLAFAMTIDESQVHTLSKVGLYLPRQVFSHGRQMFVAISKVKSRAGLKVLITDKDGNPQEEAKNVVFKELFQNI
ncbi:putative DNA helicase [Arabidopsis thaliana]|uniref:DNA helicase Pif1-like 2B domain-containing protein n=1 Tax=Arabidopsis thaliana TaxID=3702 RepID=A0A5S9XJX1_ARATH|nr:unnamed protein product [Arabidopsis thaliana]VYS60095.1 unnamed protein product [Arabidopsis thaliana]